MKLLSALSCVMAAGLVLAVASSKSNGLSPGATAKIFPPSSSDGASSKVAGAATAPPGDQAAPSPTSSGATIYYSKDSQTGEIFKLIIQRKRDGSVKVERKATGNHRGEEIENFNLIEKGIAFELVDHVIYIPSVGDTMHIIPFDPNEPVQRVIGGGATVSCFCNDSESPDQCQIFIKTGGDQNLFDCLKTTCEHCSVSWGGGGGPLLSTTGGSVIIKADVLRE